MSISIERHDEDGGIRLVVPGDVDVTTGGRLEREVLRAERGQPGALTLELTDDNDGIAEARTKTGLLGNERFGSLVRGCAGLGAGAIAGRLERAAIESQQGPPRDDVAIAVARIRD